MKKTMILLATFAMALLFITFPAFSGEQVGSMPVENLNLTEKQLDALGELIEESSEKQFEIITQIESKFIDLRQEIRKEDRFDTKIKEKRSVRKSNKLVKEITSLNGRLLKTRVEYFLKAKNILTNEQRKQVVSALEFDDDAFEGDLPEIIDLDILTLPLDLTTKQIKKILNYQTDMRIKALKINLEILYQLVDLKNELIIAEPDSPKIDKFVLKLVDLGTKLLDNRVKYFLKSKDVLTAAQKKRLIHAIMMY